MSGATWCANGLERDTHLISGDDMILVYPLAYYDDHIAGVQREHTAYGVVNPMRLFIHIYARNFLSRIGSEHRTVAMIDCWFKVHVEDLYDCCSVIEGPQKGWILSWAKGRLRYYSTFYEEWMVCVRLESEDEAYPSAYCILTLNQFHCLLISIAEYFRRQGIPLPSHFVLDDLNKYRKLFEAQRIYTHYNG